jgi:hypothetical protein
MWKLLDQAMASRLVSPLHTLALLTPRSQLSTYFVFLSLVSVNQFSLIGGCELKF